MYRHGDGRLTVACWYRVMAFSDPALHGRRCGSARSAALTSAAPGSAARSPTIARNVARSSLNGVSSAPGPALIRYAHAGSRNGGFGAHDRAQPAPDAVARDRAADPTADGVGDPRGTALIEASARHGEDSPPAARTVGQCTEGRTVSDGPDQADRRSRPLDRRRVIAARPPRVRMRSRKPCFFFRFRLFGWNVLFTHGLLERPSRRKRALGAARHHNQTRAMTCPTAGGATVQCTASRPGETIRSLPTWGVGDPSPAVGFSAVDGVDDAHCRGLWGSRRRW